MARWMWLGMVVLGGCLDVQDSYQFHADGTVTNRTRLLFHEETAEMFELRATQTEEGITAANACEVTVLDLPVKEGQSLREYLAVVEETVAVKWRGLHGETLGCEVVVGPYDPAEVPESWHMHQGGEQKVVKAEGYELRMLRPDALVPDLEGVAEENLEEAREQFYTQAKAAFSDMAWVTLGKGDEGVNVSPLTGQHEVLEDGTLRWEGSLWNLYDETLALPGWWVELEEQ